MHIIQMKEMITVIKFRIRKICCKPEKHTFVENSWGSSFLFLFYYLVFLMNRLLNVILC